MSMSISAHTPMTVAENQAQVPGSGGRMPNASSDSSLAMAFAGVQSGHDEYAGDSAMSISVPSGSSPDAVLAEAQRLLDEHSKQSIKEHNASLNSWDANRQRKVRAAHASAEEEKSAARWRFAAKLAAAGASMAGATYSVYQVAKAGTAFKSAHRADAVERDTLKTLKAEGAEQALIDQARIAITDKVSEVGAFNRAGDKLRQRAETASMFDRATAAGAEGIGQLGSANNEHKKKFQDVEAQLSDGNAQLAMEISRRRAGDDAEARKRLDEIHQSLADVTRKAASVFA